MAMHASAATWPGGQIRNAIGPCGPWRWQVLTGKALETVTNQDMVLAAMVHIDEQPGSRKLAHANGIESFRVLLKRAWAGTHQWRSRHLSGADLMVA